MISFPKEKKRVSCSHSKRPFDPHKNLQPIDVARDNGVVFLYPTNPYTVLREPEFGLLILMCFRMQTSYLQLPLTLSWMTFNAPQQTLCLALNPYPDAYPGCQINLLLGIVSRHFQLHHLRLEDMQGARDKEQRECAVEPVATPPGLVT
ncbi:hypothetical protein PR048_020258 [Dryococelus australis]|uniref:Uncharacterized protein n=1 Tax=Dryococelus australis TaxID=614101 RepID=A0ABQ9H5T1_9NEOP|nr:hypothetical protein PR048_020258 [Dryococelus australis]